MVNTWNVYFLITPSGSVAVQCLDAYPETFFMRYHEFLLENGIVRIDSSALPGKKDPTLDREFFSLEDTPKIEVWLLEQGAKNAGKKQA